MLKYSPLFRALYRASFLGFILGLTACNEPVEKHKPVPSVTIIKITPVDTSVNFEFVGRTASSQQVEVRSRVEGFLDDRLYTEGSIVTKGDVMFKMDAKPFQTQLDAAQAALAEQKAKLKVHQANLGRVKPLAKANAVSKKELDDAQGKVNSSAASVEMARADVETAKLNLSYTTIYAPVTGASSYARTQNGAYVNVSNSLLTYVAQLDPIWVDFNISENDILKYRRMRKDGILNTPDDGQYDVELKLADDSSYPQIGRIFFSDANYSTETGTFLLRAEFNNPDQLLRPGQFVRVLLKGAVQPNAILVPQKAVLQGAKGFFVWTVDENNMAQIRNVEVGDWQDDSWFILKGLGKGDRVVVDGIAHLASNIKVNIKTGSSKPATGD